jgi:CRISPR-associated protein Cas1
MPHDLHDLPRIEDGWSYLYVEHCKIDREDKAVALHDQDGKVSVPCASLALLLLGPGTSITHEAIKTLADNGCLVGWCGEGIIRFYALGTGETRHASKLVRQALLVSHPKLKHTVIYKMYRMRFKETIQDNLNIQQLRGMEGQRVRQSYAIASNSTGVPWNGRNFDPTNWRNADPVNRALSVANSCLYGICHAAIVSIGYSPGLGFIHTGHQLSFVYDIADLYKADLTIPLAFEVTASQPDNLERAVRLKCRDRFNDIGLLKRIVPDIEEALNVEIPAELTSEDFDSDKFSPVNLYDPATGVKPGGVNYSNDGRE